MFPRLQARGSASIVAPWGTFRCSVENLSATGLLVVASQMLRVGTGVSVLIHVPECRRSHQLNVYGVVRWARPRTRTDLSTLVEVGILLAHPTPRSHELMAGLARGSSCPLCDALSP